MPGTWTERASTVCRRYPAGMTTEDRAQMAQGIALILLAAAVLQFGASLATAVMPVFGLAALVLVRYTMMAASHTALSVRLVPRITDRRQLWWGVLLAVPLLAMNVSIYLAFARIGVGMAVSIEMLGPILLGAISSPHRRGWAYAALGLVGMLLLTGPTLSTDALGIAFAAIAGLSWAFYLLANRAAGRRLPGLVPSAMASLTGLVVLIPIALVLGTAQPLTWPVLLIGLAAGVLSSALPYALDVLAMRRVPMHVASTLQSSHPIAAVLFGAIVLGERLTPVELVGVALICTATTLVVRSARRQPRACSTQSQTRVSSEDSEAGERADGS